MTLRINAAERVVADSLEAEGWELLHRGWPDFLAVRGDKVRFIEVKRAFQPDPDNLSMYQRRVAAILAKLGIEVEVLSPHYTEADRLHDMALVDEAFAEMAEIDEALDALAVQE